MIDRFGIVPRVRLDDPDRTSHAGPVIDRFGCELAGSTASLAAWNEAWACYTHFRGGPLDVLADANRHDDQFVLGPVMTGLYSVLSGAALDAAVVVDNLARARCRIHEGDRRGLGHLDAFEHVCRGDFTAGADAFMQLAGPPGPGTVEDLDNDKAGDVTGEAAGGDPAGGDRCGGFAEFDRGDVAGDPAGDFAALRFAHDRGATPWHHSTSPAGDFAALRFAHDLYLHVGAAERRCETEAALLANWPSQDQHRHFVEGMHAFSLTEVGRHEEAEQLGAAALEADPEDLWARHALAHVYENTDDTSRSLELLADSVDIWADQNLLAIHMWWHLALRLLAKGDIASALEIFDQQQSQATTAFQLCDQTSLLWHAECAGFSVGDRWDDVADRWDDVAERHTCAFVDLHAALAYIRRPGHPGADRWFAGLAARAPVDPRGGHEIDDIFADVAVPLIGALRSNDPRANVDRSLLDDVRRIGGSEAQRRIVPLAVDRLSGRFGSRRGRPVGRKRGALAIERLSGTLAEHTEGSERR